MKYLFKVYHSMQHYFLHRVMRLTSIQVML